MEYNPDWPFRYQKEAELLQGLISHDVLLQLHHYGSTAVPGLAAKPTIDIIAEVSSLDAGKAEMIPILEQHGYGHDWYKEHLVFFKGYFTDDPIKYHVHCAPLGHSVFDGLLFRDYLLTHPETAKQYEELKYRLAKTHKYDREAYTDAKGEFVRRVVAKG